MKLSVCKSFKWSWIPSAAIVLAGIIVVLVAGFNLGIDFSGGTIYNVDVGEAFEADDIEAIVRENITASTSDIRVSVSDGNTAIIQYQDASADPEEQDAARAALEDDLKERYTNLTVTSCERQGAVASAELVENAITSVLIACALMLLYITIRFEFWSGVAALAALIHDVLVMLAVTAICRIQINSSLIAAALTIVGYSINNTIVVFDRIRDVRRSMGGKAEYSAIADTAVRNTLTRSIYTTVTTLATIVILYFLGVTSIKEFALPIIVGLLAGCWSSVMLAAPFWVACRNLVTGKGKKKASKKK